MTKIKELFLTYRKYIIIFVCGFAAGISFLFFQKSKIEIIKEEVIKTEYKQKIDKTDTIGLWDCYQSTIDIKGKIKNNEMIITAEDKCKLTQKKFKLNTVSKKNILLFQYGHFFKTNLIQNFSIMYYRELVFNIGLGCGLNLKQEKNNSDLGWQIGVMYKF